MAAHQEDVIDPTTVTVIREKKDVEQYVAAEDIVKSAQKATDDGHAMGLMEGLRKYPSARFLRFPGFQKRYGVLTNGSYQIPANLQAAISNGVNAGEIVGLLLNGLLCDWLGYRW
ncbi:hypothetical protein CNMCM5793_003312 [Aspergillus hiratsukae]|uniref:Uncharacterized protein n=1 Tax=Aspergillus hiratsukae TaxID=1194566 RepID=A0A8H6UWV9_9EURO|nr:hypothetical protein CNMCM5793_003312 [Aspergillus hiratsukae]KAF7169827.1 hypothetical protein CNMCM6106_004730 [Aspergillus hiratsukae]